MDKHAGNTSYIGILEVVCLKGSGCTSNRIKTRLCYYFGAVNHQPVFQNRLCNGSLCTDKANECAVPMKLRHRDQDSARSSIKLQLDIAGPLRWWRCLALMCDEYYILERDAVWSGTSPTFRRNVLLPSLRLKRNSSRQPKGNMQQAHLIAGSSFFW
jgi:hypothetical protein